MFVKQPLIFKYRFKNFHSPIHCKNQTAILLLGEHLPLPSPTVRELELCLIHRDAGDVNQPIFHHSNKFLLTFNMSPNSLF